MDFTINNGLSMTGGDDISDIQTEIDILDASVVHKTGNLNESIDGQKVFTSDFGINNASTTIISSVGVTLSSGSNYLNGTQNRIGSSLPVASTSFGNKIDCIGGYNLMTSATTSAIANQIEATGGASNAMTTTGAGNNVFNAQGSGKNSFIAQTGNNELQAGTANKMLIGTTEKLNMTSTLTTLTNGTTTINCNTGNFNVFATGDTSINVPNGKSHFFEVDGVDKVVVGQNSTAITNVANTITSTTGDNTITTSGGNNFMTITGGSFKENILTANANSGLANRIVGFNNYLTGSDTNYLFAPKNSIVSTTTSNATSNLIDATGTGSGNTIRAKGANKITTTSTLALANVIEVTGTGGGSTIKTSTGQNTISSTSGRIVLSTTSTLADGVLVYNGGFGGGITIRADGGGSTITSEVNGTHSFFVNGTQRLLMTSSKTTITNADVDIIGQCNATRYNVGTSLTKKPLSSMIMGVGHCTITLPNVGGGLSVTTNGTYVGGSIFVRTPDFGIFVPTFITIQYSGTFTGGAGATHRIEVINNSTGGTIIASTPNVAYTSALATSQLVGDTTFTTTGNFSSGNLFTIRCVITTPVVITGSTKVAYVQVYGYQINP